MLMIAWIFTFLQTLPSTVFIFFIFWFIPATLLILVFIFLEQMRGERPLIPHVPHLFFGNVLLFSFPGPIVGTSPLLLIVASWWTCHVDIERKIQSASCRPLTRIPVTIHHVDAREGPSINFHGELFQDQSVLLDSRLNLPMELFAVVGVVGE
jgi:hypothetical protein